MHANPAVNGLLPGRPIRTKPSASRAFHRKGGTAIIAATAVTYGIPLITRNEGDFKHIPGLDLRNPFAISP